MARDNMIKKIVGKSVKESPLQRAYRLSKMLEEFRGKKKDDNYAHIRKLVGRTK